MLRPWSGQGRRMVDDQCIRRAAGTIAARREQPMPAAMLQQRCVRNLALEQHRDRNPAIRKPFGAVERELAALARLWKHPDVAAVVEDLRVGQMVGLFEYRYRRASDPVAADRRDRNDGLARRV